MLVKLTLPVYMSVQLLSTDVSRITAYATKHQTTFEQALIDMLSIEDSGDDGALYINSLDPIIEKVYPDSDSVTQFGINRYLAFRKDIQPQLDVLLNGIAWKDNYHYESVNDFVNVVMEIASERFMMNDNEQFARTYIASVADKYM